MQETIVTSIIIITLVFLILFASIIFLVRRDFQIKAEAERKMYNAILLAQENERQLIAQDIHDELGGLLTSAKLSIALARSEQSLDFIRDNMEHVNDIIEMAAVAAKNASNALTPAAIAKYGLKGAVLDIQDRYKRCPAHFDIMCEYEQEPSEFVQINLFRIISEVINNSVKYAEAQNIRVHLLSRDNSEFVASISDDGVGFDWDEVKKGKKSHGLSNIENRCALMNAQLKVVTAKGKGCNYCITLKYPHGAPY
jgi:two-component system, NarL family, sensor kinase